MVIRLAPNEPIRVTQMEIRGSNLKICLKSLLSESSTKWKFYKFPSFQSDSIIEKFRKIDQFALKMLLFLLGVSVVLLYM